MRNIVLKLLGCLTLLLFGWIGMAGALTLEEQYSIPVGVEYNDNVHMSSRVPQYAWKYTANPHVGVVLTEGLNQLSADGTLKITRSSDKVLIMEREDPAIDLGWKKEFFRGAVGLGLHYDEATTRDTEFDATGDIIIVENTRKNIAYLANATYQLTERAGFSVNAKNSESTYSGGNHVNQQNQSINSSLSYLWNQSISTSVNLDYSRQLPDRGSKTQLVSAGLGTQWALNERLNLSTRVGVRKITRSTSVNTVGHTATGAGGIGWNTDTSLSYLIGENSSAKLGFSRSAEPSSAGGLREKDTLEVGLKHEFSENDRAGVDLSMRRVYSGNTGQGRQGMNENKNLNIWYARNLAGNWDGKIYYQRKDTDNNNNQASANILGLSVVYSLEKF